MAATLVLGTAGLAQAADPNAPATDVAETIAAAAPDATPVLDSTRSAEAFAAGSGTSTVAVPLDAADPVTITSTDPSAPDLAVTLPNLGGTDDARQAEDGTLVYTSDDDASLAVQPLADGSTRFLSVLESKNAPERYDYTFDGLALELQDDGSVVVLDVATPVGFIPAPWATDADGTDVPTRYEVDGSTLTQVVPHAPDNYTYPITADPRYKPSWWNYTILLNRAETRDAKDGLLVGQTASAIAALAGGPAAVAIAAAISVYSTAISIYYDRGKCVKFVWYPTAFLSSIPMPVPQPYGGSKAGGYCR